MAYIRFLEGAAVLLAIAMLSFGADFVVVKRICRKTTGCTFGLCVWANILHVVLVFIMLSLLVVFPSRYTAGNAFSLIAATVIFLKFLIFILFWYGYGEAKKELNVARANFLFLASLPSNTAVMTMFLILLID